MNERADSSEFLLGIEEYLRYNNYDRMGKVIHALSRSLLSENAEQQTINIFLQEFGGSIGVTNVELADLMHQVVKSDELVLLRSALLTYLAKKHLTNQNLKDYIFSIIKTKNLTVIRSASLKFIGKETLKASLKDLIFSTLKCSSNDENLFKTVLNFLHSENTFNDDETQYVKNILHSKNFYDESRVLMEKFLESNISQEKKDLLNLILRFGNTENVVKSLLQFVGKTEEEDNNYLGWLAFSLKKADEIENIYKTVLLLISKYEALSVDVLDLIHGFTKDDKKEFYKSLLLYLGKGVTDDEPMSSLSVSIRKALLSENFQEEIIKSYLTMLDRQFLGNKVFRGINNYIKNGYPKEPINDAFSRSQVKSKIWLISELAKIQEHFSNVLIMAGWFGQLKAFYADKISYNKMRIIDIERLSCEVSDYIFNLTNLEDYKVKSICADINNLILHKNGYELILENFKEGTIIKEKFLPDLIINTSAEHMPEDWFNQIRFKGLENNPLLVIQSNNLFDVPEHTNCVYSTQHLLKKFPMREVLYEGELQLKGYKRMMVIGRP